MKSHLLKRSWDDLWSHKLYYFGIWFIYLLISSGLAYLAQLAESTSLEQLLGVLVSMSLFALLGFLLRSLAYKQIKPEITIQEFVAEDVSWKRMGRLAWKQVLLMILSTFLTLLIGLLFILVLFLFIGSTEFIYEYRVNLQSTMVEILTSAGLALLILAALQLLAPFVRSLPYVNVLNVRQGFWASIKEALSITGQNYFYLLGTMLKIFLIKVLISSVFLFGIILTLQNLNQMGEAMVILAIFFFILVFLLLLIPLYIWEQICYTRAFVVLLEWDQTK